MTSSPSLQYKTVLNPRAKSVAKSFSKVVEQYGGIPVEIPLLDFKPADLTPPLQALIEQLHTYDWIIFTSKVTVDTFLTYLSEISSPFPKIAAIGAKTAQALEKKGFKVEFIPEEYVAEAFVKEFSKVVGTGDKLLLPKGNLARDYIASELQELGVTVDEMIVYDTFFPEESKEKLAQSLSHRGLEIIPFTSPSTVDHFMETVQNSGFEEILKTCIFACIGPVAKKRAESFNLSVQVVPKVYTVEELLKSIAEYIAERSNGEKEI